MPNVQYLLICKHRFCIYEIHTKSLGWELPTPLFFLSEKNKNRYGSPKIKIIEKDSMKKSISIIKIVC